MTTSKKILDLLENQNKKQIDLIRFLLGKYDVKGADRTKFSRYLNGVHKFPLEYVSETAKFLNINPKDLISNEVSNERPVNYVPVVGTASCGALDMDYSQEVGRKAFYLGDYWKPSLYCVIANGDSMSPEIEDGDEVIIDPDVACQSGDIVHYKIGNESAIKVLYKDNEANLIQFIPYNQSEDFKTKTVRLDDEEAIRQLTYYKVVSVNKLKFNNRLARLRLIGR